MIFLSFCEIIIIIVFLRAISMRRREKTNANIKRNVEEYFEYQSLCMPLPYDRTSRNKIPGHKVCRREKKLCFFSFLFWFSLRSIGKLNFLFLQSRNLNTNLWFSLFGEQILYIDMINKIQKKERAKSNLQKKNVKEILNII